MNRVPHGCAPPIGLIDPKTTDPPEVRLLHDAFPMATEAPEHQDLLDKYGLFPRLREEYDKERRRVTRLRLQRRP